MLSTEKAKWWKIRKTLDSVIYLCTTIFNIYLVYCLLRGMRSKRMHTNIAKLKRPFKISKDSRQKQLSNIPDKTNKRLFKNLHLAFRRPFDHTTFIICVFNAITLAAQTCWHINESLFFANPIDFLYIIGYIGRTLLFSILFSFVCVKVCEVGLKTRSLFARRIITVALCFLLFLFAASTTSYYLREIIPEANSFQAINYLYHFAVWLYSLLCQMYIGFSCYCIAIKLKSMKKTKVVKKMNGADGGTSLGDRDIISCSKLTPRRENGHNNKKKNTAIKSTPLERMNKTHRSRIPGLGRMALTLTKTTSNDKAVSISKSNINPRVTTRTNVTGTHSSGNALSESTRETHNRLFRFTLVTSINGAIGMSVTFCYILMNFLTKNNIPFLIELLVLSLITDYSFLITNFGFIYLIWPGLMRDSRLSVKVKPVKPSSSMNTKWI